MKDKIIPVIVALLVWASLYVGFAFVEWEPDPAKWNELARFGLVVLCILCSFGVASFYVEDSEQTRELRAARERLKEQEEKIDELDQEVDSLEELVQQSIGE